MHTKYVIAYTTIVVSIVALIIHFAFFSKDEKTAIEKGRKIEIQTQIAIQDKERTGLQKAVWDAIDKGLNDRKEIEINHSQDHEKINIYVLSLSDSLLIKLFEERFGHLDKERDKILHHKDTDSENR